MREFMGVSLCMICLNEAEALKDFNNNFLNKYRHIINDVVVVDTGSSDDTAIISKDLGYNIETVGNRFHYVVEQEHIDKFVRYFKFNPYMKGGDSLFDFAEARNYALSKAKNDWCLNCGPDWGFRVDDKLLTEINLDEFDLFNISFTLTKTQEFARPLLFNKLKVKFHDMIHEWPGKITPDTIVRKGFTKNFVGWQNIERERGGVARYIKHLEYMFVTQPESARGMFYLGREYFLKSRWEESVNILLNAIKMDPWKPEKSYSHILIADALCKLGNKIEAEKHYHNALIVDDTRREPFHKLALFHFGNKNYQSCINYCKAGLEIPLKECYYFTDPELYTWKLHDLLQQCYSRIGKQEEARKHWIICMDLNPNDKGLRSNIGYYFPKREGAEKIKNI
jgi:glycosyltransferase involved in cell wall biosynthesis